MFRTWRSAIRASTWLMNGQEVAVIVDWAVVLWMNKGSSSGPIPIYITKFYCVVFDDIWFNSGHVSAALPHRTAS